MGVIICHHGKIVEETGETWACKESAILDGILHQEEKYSGDVVITISEVLNNPYHIIF